MGWASGSDIATAMINGLRHQLQAKDRYKVYDILFRELRAADWDTVDEALGLDFVFDELVYEHEPDWRPDDDDPRSIAAIGVSDPEP